MGRPRKKAQGLGDTVENVLEATGIAKVAKFILGEDCGCQERKAKLNNLFPYFKPLCLEESEYNYLHEFFKKPVTTLKPSEQNELLRIYKRVFSTRQEATNCTSCWIKIIEELKTVYNEYKD
jgi:hypothetical protein